MSNQLGIPKAAMNSLIQLVDHNAQVKPGMEVLIGAHIDGAWGSENLVDPMAVNWVQSVVVSRGANVSVIWIDEIMKKHKWRVPPILKGAVANADLFINFSLDLAISDPGWPCIQSIIEAAKMIRKPLAVTLFALPEFAVEQHAFLTQNKIAAFGDAKRAVAALARVSKYASYRVNR